MSDSLKDYSSDEVQNFASASGIAGMMETAPPTIDYSLSSFKTISNGQSYESKESGESKESKYSENTPNRFEKTKFVKKSEESLIKKDPALQKHPAIEKCFLAARKRLALEQERKAFDRFGRIKGLKKKIAEKQLRGFESDNTWKSNSSNLKQKSSIASGRLPSCIAHRNEPEIVSLSTVPGYNPNSSRLDHNHYPLSSTASPLKLDKAKKETAEVSYPLCLKCGKMADKEMTKYRNARAIGFQQIFSTTIKNHNAQLALVLSRNVFGAWKGHTLLVKNRILQGERMHTLRLHVETQDLFHKWKNKIKGRILERKTEEIERLREDLEEARELLEEQKEDTPDESETEMSET